MSWDRRQHHRHVLDDNGAEELSWPDGGHAFRSEKDTNWEGGWRVPCAIRWPVGHQAGPRQQRHLLSPGYAPHARGRRRGAEHQGEAQTGYQAGKKTFIGLYRRLQSAPVWKGDVKENPRPGFLYWSDEGDLMASVQSLEDPFHGNTCGRMRCLAGSIHTAELPSRPTCGATPSRAEYLRHRCFTGNAMRTASSRWRQQAR